MPRTMAAKYGSLASPTSTPTIPVRPVAIAFASAFGEYSSGAAASSTRARVARLTGYSLPLSTRDAVATDTLACLATSNTDAISPPRR